MLRQLFITIFLVIFLFSILQAQIDHYETIVYDNDVWSYRLADSEPPSNWMQPAFDASAWATGQGGFGYGDNDDNTEVPAGYGVYFRTEFEITDLADIQKLVLDADYDDAFVAYLNGVEIARANIGTEGIPPAFDEQPGIYHEAGLYDAIDPERFILNTEVNLLENGTNTLAIHLLNYGVNSSDLTGRFFLSAGIVSDIYNYGDLPYWFDDILDFSSSNLPLIVIDTEGGTIEDEPSISAHMGIIDNGTGNINTLGDTYNDYDGRISIEIRGASSQSFEKKGYRIETQDELGDNNNVSLLGMPSENDWVLHGPYSDKSLIRNVLTYHLGRLTGRYAPRAQLCELHINNEYRGVYVLVEKIKRDQNRVDIAKVKDTDIEGDELTGGYLMQIDRDNDDLDNEGWYSDNGDWPYFYVVEDPKYEDILPVQRNYIENYINDFEDAMAGSNYLNEYEDYLDVASYADYFLVNELAKHIDAFKLSFYLHKKKDSNGGKLHLGPIWDFNLAYGNFDFDCNPDPSGWIYPCTSMAGWMDRAITIPAVQDSIHCRWVQLRETVYQEDAIMEFIDNLVAELSEAQARNFSKFDVLDNYIWPNDYVGETYEDEINFLKNYILVRLEWMDENMLGAANDCTVISSNNELEKALIIESFPNPATDEFHVSFSDASLKDISFSIYNVEGKLMMKEKINSEEILKIKIQNWNQGTYIFNLHNNQGKILNTGTLLKQ